MRESIIIYKKIDTVKKKLFLYSKNFQSRLTKDILEI